MRLIAHVSGVADSAVPAGSAQFDGAGLDLKPNAVAPLLLELPLADGSSIGLTLGGDVVPALRALSESKKKRRAYHSPPLGTSYKM